MRFITQFTQKLWLLQPKCIENKKSTLERSNSPENFIKIAWKVFEKGPENPLSPLH